MARHRTQIGDPAMTDRDELHTTKTHMEYKYRPKFNTGIPIPKEFLHKYPDMPIFQAQEKWHKYLSEIKRVLLKRLPFMKDNITTISTKKLRDDCGRFFPYGKNDTRYVYNEFYPLYPFYARTKKGSNISGKNSQIMIVNQNLIDLLIDTADHNELVALYYGDLTEDNIHELVWVRIDMQSLSNYIKSTQEQLKSINQDTEKEYYFKLLRSLRQAKYIKIIVEFFDNDKFPMQVKKSQYGRTYYKGLNLQNCHKEVRNAALGDNYQYDIEAAVYAIKLMLIEDIYKEKGIEFTGHYVYTKEYIDHKSHIRNRLAQHITAYPDKLKLVKEAITAIGFGARISGGAWLEDSEIQYPSINHIIMNEKDRERFLNDPWVIEFYKEQTKLTREITTYYKNKNGWCEAHMANLPRSKNKLGKYRKTAIMSYLFQRLETMIMEEITKNLDKDNILLIVHDCIITEHPINGYDLQDIRYKLKSYSEYLKITNEFNKGWLDIDTMKYEIKHKQFIQEEERKANNYTSQFIQSDNIQIPKKLYKSIITQNDSMVYDGYDEGRKHEQYDPNTDQSIHDMTAEELHEHYRILGIENNTYPEFIKKLL